MIPKYHWILTSTIFSSPIAYQISSTNRFVPIGIPTQSSGCIRASPSWYAAIHYHLHRTTYIYISTAEQPPSNKSVNTQYRHTPLRIAKGSCVSVSGDPKLHLCWTSPHAHFSLNPRVHTTRSANTSGNFHLMQCIRWQRGAC